MQGFWGIQAVQGYHVPSSLGKLPILSRLVRNTHPPKLQVYKLPAFCCFLSHIAFESTYSVLLAYVPHLSERGRSLGSESVKGVQKLVAPSNSRDKHLHF